MAPGFAQDADYFNEWETNLLHIMVEPDKPPRVTGAFSFLFSLPPPFSLPSCLNLEVSRDRP